MIRALIPDDVNALGLMLLAFVGVFLPIVIVKSARRPFPGPQAVQWPGPGFKFAAPRP